MMINLVLYVYKVEFALFDANYSLIMHQLSQATVFYL
jgi:hypothetical protein